MSQLKLTIIYNALRNYIIIYISYDIGGFQANVISLLEV